MGVFTGVLSAAFLFFFLIPTVQAAETPVELKERTIFYLDWGFVGRPVSLDVNGGKTIVSWDAQDLTAPTTLMVEIETGVTSSINGATLEGEIVHLTWADPYHLSARGVKVTSQNGCVPSTWTSCSLYKQTGETWQEVSDGRAYGHARVRMGTKTSAYMTHGSASWYKYKNCRCAASPDFPKGTRVRVRSALSGKFTVVRINDWGPERDIFPERVIDLDAVAFKELAPLGAGVINVSVEPLEPTDPDYALADSLPPEAVVVTAAAPKKTSPSVAEEPKAPAWVY